MFRFVSFGEGEDEGVKVKVMMMMFIGDDDLLD